MITEKFQYVEIARRRVEGKRLYDTDSGFLPSVTTLLDKTKPQESRDALNNWRDRVGNDEAARITREAANVGTHMHLLLENWVKNDRLMVKGAVIDNLPFRIAKRMAQTVVDNIQTDLTEIWGTEVGLYYPGLYAGTTDLVGVWKGRESICDFKQTNKPKKREWIEDYFLQGTMYAEAHNELFGTNIQSVAIFMCSRDCEFQLFEIVDDEFQEYSKRAAARIAQYYDL